MTEAAAVTAYFHTHDQAQEAAKILDVFFTVLRPPPVEPWNGRAWGITVFMREGISEETLFVTPQVRDQVFDLVQRQGGRILTGTPSSPPP